MEGGPDTIKTMKQCCICKENHSLECFAKNKAKKDGLQSQCKNCQKVYRKKHYEDNRQYYIDKAKVWSTNQKIIFYNWLQQQQCIDCGNDNFKVLEFDHMQDKSFNISKKIASLTFDAIMKEVQKCEVVCANCHRIRTAERDNYYSFLSV